MSTDVLTTSVARMEQKIDQLIRDVNEPPRDGNPGGLLVRAKTLEDELAELRTLLMQLRSRLEAVESGPGRAALSWWDRVGLALLGLVLTGIGGLVGAHFSQAAR